MIVFYKKGAGEIIGTLEGRIHGEDHTKIEMEDAEKLVIQWKPIKWYTEEGQEVEKDHPKVYTADFEPDHEQKELIIEFEKNSLQVYDYKVKDGKFVK